MSGIRGLTGWTGPVLDAPDPRTLARFYRDLLGWEVGTDEPDWVTLRRPGTTTYVAFQLEERYVRPTWPAAEGEQLMMAHLDIGVRELQPAVEDALALGAVLSGHQPQDDVRVMLDPAGHPFCLYLDDE